MYFIFYGWKKVGVGKFSIVTVRVHVNMDQNELFVACRHGNVEKLQILVEERDVELNIRDMWDSTPL